MDVFLFLKKYYIGYRATLCQCIYMYMGIFVPLHFVHRSEKGVFGRKLFAIFFKKTFLNPTTAETATHSQMVK